MPGASGATRALGFNSRTREGCDFNGDSMNMTDNVSIHAPGRGATSSAFELSKTKLQFQFTHPGGVRLL